ncbi:unnamed protein product [Allacma fusca]|uniref:Uncharacterized protein n=1 Tax=Allacma fusca TaxID=39272 RepID=A0A8J2KLA1_9HEXA|nr:unnamed protein product [Allacma fusca]
MVENYKIGGFGVILSVLIGVILTGVQTSGVGHAARVLELSERFLEVRKDGVWLVKVKVLFILYEIRALINSGTCISR